MHRILQLLMTQPDLLVEHATAYAELATADVQTTSNASKHSVLWSAALLCCLSVAAILIGGGLMIWATVADNSIRLPWVFFSVPLIPVAAAFVCVKILRPTAQAQAFAKVREQFAADMQMLREVSVP